METIKETLQLMISLSQIQDVEVRGSLGKIVSRNILFFVANFSVTVFKIDDEIQILFNCFVDSDPSHSQPPECLHNYSSPCYNDTSSIWYVINLKKKKDRCFSYHALDLCRSPVSMRLMFMYVLLL